MYSPFDLKNFLIENRLTSLSRSKLLNEDFSPTKKYESLFDEDFQNDAVQESIDLESTFMLDIETVARKLDLLDEQEYEDINLEGDGIRLSTVTEKYKVRLVAKTLINEPDFEIYDIIGTPYCGVVEYEFSRPAQAYLGIEAYNEYVHFYKKSLMKKVIRTYILFGYVGLSKSVFDECSPKKIEELINQALDYNLPNLASLISKTRES